MLQRKLRKNILNPHPKLEGNNGEKSRRVIFRGKLKPLVTSPEVKSLRRESSRNTSLFLIISVSTLLISHSRAFPDAAEACDLVTNYFT